MRGFFGAGDALIGVFGVVVAVGALGCAATPLPARPGEPTEEGPAAVAVEKEPGAGGAAQATGEASGGAGASGGAEERRPKSLSAALKDRDAAVISATVLALAGEKAALPDMPNLLGQQIKGLVFKEHQDALLGAYPGLSLEARRALAEAVTGIVTKRRLNSFGLSRSPVWHLSRRSLADRELGAELRGRLALALLRSLPGKYTTLQAAAPDVLPTVEQAETDLRGEDVAKVALAMRVLAKVRHPRLRSRALQKLLDRDKELLLHLIALAPRLPAEALELLVFNGRLYSINRTQDMDLKALWETILARSEDKAQRNRAAVRLVLTPKLPPAQIGAMARDTSLRRSTRRLAFEVWLRRADPFPAAELLPFAGQGLMPAWAELELGLQKATPEQRPALVAEALTSAGSCGDRRWTFKHLSKKQPALLKKLPAAAKAEVAVLALLEQFEGAVVKRAGPELVVFNRHAGIAAQMLSSAVNSYNAGGGGAGAAQAAGQHTEVARKARVAADRKIRPIRGKLKAIAARVLAAEKRIPTVAARQKLQRCRNAKTYDSALYMMHFIGAPPRAR